MEVIRVLAIESSTQLASVALAEESRILAEEKSFRQKSHSEFLNPAIGRVMQKAQLSLEDIDCIGVCHGPGSFTGVRVAINVAKSLAYVLGRPLVAVTSLELLALRVGPGRRIMPMINAYKDMIYYGLFENTGDSLVQLVAPSLMPVSELQNHLKEDVICVGDGYEAYKSRWEDKLLGRLHRPKEEDKDFPLAEALARVTFERFKSGSTLEWNQILPLYLKASEAEENLRKGLLKSVRNF